MSRDIYYHDPDLFRQQETVDRYIDDIAHTFQVTRSALNVVRTEHAGPSHVVHRLTFSQASSPKGLMVGFSTTHERIHTALVPEDLAAEHEFADISHLKWVLVVEKEVREKMHQRTPLTLSRLRSKAWLRENAIKALSLARDCWSQY